MNTAEAIFLAIRIWLVAGGLVAAVFLTVGLDRIDEDSRGAYIFRPLLLPGVLLIWPLVLWRWWQLESGRFAEADRFRAVRAPHAGAAITMAVAIVAVVAIGLSVRQQWPADIAPERLAAPPEVGQ